MSKPFELTYTGNYRASFLDMSGRECGIKPDERNGQPCLELSVTMPPKQAYAPPITAIIELTPELVRELGYAFDEWAKTGRLPEVG